MQRVTFPLIPGRVNILLSLCDLVFLHFFFRLFFFSFFFSPQPSRATPMKATQTLKQPYVLNLSAQTQMTSMTSPTDFFFFFQPPLQILFFFFFLVKKHYIISLKNIRQFELAVIHPVTITLVVCIVKPVRTVSQKQIIKLTALTLGKVREELSNTLMLTLLQSLYLNNSPGS